MDARATFPAARAAERPDQTVGVRGTVWIDIENPPQVQYLLPLAAAFRQRGSELVVTARDYGITFQLLRDRNVPFTPVGAHFGGAKAAKVVGNLRRTLELRRIFRQRGCPDVLVSVSRSAALTARSFGIPSFSICDYEYVNMAVFRFAQSYVVHPEAISAETLIARGITSQRLVAFRGIKEDLTFAGVVADAFPPYALPQLEDFSGLRILVRPPAEESHYHRRESSSMAYDLMARLARRADVAVIFSPRYAWQADALSDHEWHRPPVVVTEAVPFISLYRAVDAVISGGGTMTREAAYFGVPAISMFQGLLGGVDRFLESTGRLTILRKPADLDHLDLHSLERRPLLNSNSAACDDIVDEVLRRVALERARTI